MKTELGFDTFEQGEMTPFDREIYLSLVMQKEQEKKKATNPRDLYDPQNLAGKP